MAVLMIAEVPNQTAEKYDAMLAHLADPMRAAPGFIAHASADTPAGWRVYEMWNSKKESDAFFARFVVPNLPPGIHPKRSYVELHSMVTFYGVLTPTG